MAKFKHIYCELYKADFYYIACSAKEYARKIEAEFGVNPDVNPDQEGAKFTVLTKGNTSIGVIWLADKTRLDWLAHECAHAAFWLLRSRGLWCEHASEEAYTYLIEYLFREITRK